jgi:hypothetical protein
MLRFDYQAFDIALLAALGGLLILAASMAA